MVNRTISPSREFTETLVGRVGALLRGLKETVGRLPDRPRGGLFGGGACAELAASRAEVEIQRLSAVCPRGCLAEQPERRMCELVPEPS